MQMNLLKFSFCLFLAKSSNLFTQAASKLDKQYTKSSVNNITLTCTLSMETAWVRLRLSSLSAHLIDSLSQCVASETATQIKERSVRNRFPAALLYCLLYRASFKLGTSSLFMLTRGINIVRLHC